MKKAIFTLAMAVFALAANAQFVAGGSLSFSHNGGNLNTDPASAVVLADEAADATTMFSICPKVGYQLNDKVQVGLSIGINYDYGRNYGTAASLLQHADNNYDEYTSTTQWLFAFNPYVRYNVTNIGKCTLFCEAQLGVEVLPTSSSYNNDNGGSHSTTTDGEVSGYSIGLKVVPGLNYRLSDHCSLDLYVNLAGLYGNYTSMKHESSSVTRTSSSHNYGFIADASVQSLNNHLDNFGIGFNYHF